MNLRLLALIVFGLIGAGALFGLAKKHRSTVFAVVAAVVATLFLMPTPEVPPAPDPEVVYREVESPALLDSIRELELEVSRLRGREEREPETRTVGADPLPAPEACVFTTTIRDGRLQVAPTFRLPDSIRVDGGPAYRGELLGGVDVRDCDDGLSVGPDGSVVCDRPVLGHLSLAGELGLGSTLDAQLEVVPAAGLSWTPSYRSPWDVSVLVQPRDGQLWGHLRIRRLLELF